MQLLECHGLEQLISMKMHVTPFRDQSSLLSTMGQQFSLPPLSPHSSAPRVQECIAPLLSATPPVSLSWFRQTLQTLKTQKLSHEGTGGSAASAYASDHGSSQSLPFPLSRATYAYLFVLDDRSLEQHWAVWTAINQNHVTPAMRARSVAALQHQHPLPLYADALEVFSALILCTSAHPLAQRMDAVLSLFLWPSAQTNPAGGGSMFVPQSLGLDDLLVVLTLIATGLARITGCTPPTAEKIAPLVLQLYASATGQKLPPPRGAQSSAPSKAMEMDLQMDAVKLLRIAAVQTSWVEWIANRAGRSDELLATFSYGTGNEESKEHHALLTFSRRGIACTTHQFSDGGCLWAAVLLQYLFPSQRHRIVYSRSPTVAPHSLVPSTRRWKPHHSSWTIHEKCTVGVRD
jgi:hypothetical protein